jgi:hypothetical protein
MEVVHDLAQLIRQVAGSGSASGTWPTSAS